MVSKITFIKTFKGGLVAWNIYCSNFLKNYLKTTSKIHDENFHSGVCVLQYVVGE